MEINYDEVKKIKLSHLKHYVLREDMKSNFSDSADSQHHYKLLSYIAEQKDNQLIYELGTHWGLGSVALSTNNTNRIITYDITDRTHINLPTNIEQRVGNIFNLGQEDELLNADIIFLDTAHEGPFENLVYQHLKLMKWKGILILDDINFNKPMREFWDSIDITKYDVTEIGHREHNTGTGIVDFNNQIKIVK
jgi:predicted O-methyltransferase YrrM